MRAARPRDDFLSRELAIPEMIVQPNRTTVFLGNDECHLLASRGARTLFGDHHESTTQTLAAPVGFRGDGVAVPDAVGSELRQRRLRCPLATRAPSWGRLAERRGRQNQIGHVPGTHEYVHGAHGSSAPLPDDVHASRDRGNSKEARKAVC